MRDTLEFTIDVIEIIPDNSVCYIQAPSIDNLEFLSILENSKYNWAKQITLTLENKQRLKNLLIEIELEDLFHNVTIENQNEKIFEGHDGMEIGEISNKLNIPKWFKEKYIENQYCIISRSW